MRSCYRVVKNTVQPTKNHSPLLEQLVDVSLMGKEQYFQSAPISEKHSCDADAYSDSDLIWDNNPMKSTFLCTIDSTSNERTKMRSLLFRNTLGTVGYDVASSEGSTLEKDKECERSFPGTLTILTHCSVLSVEFENIVHAEEGLAVNENSTDPTDRIYNEADASEKAPSKIYDKDEKKSNGPKLMAVAVKYIDMTSDRKEVKVVKPSGGGEIILCAGVFESPRILLASGLGEFGIVTDDAGVYNDSGADAVMCERGVEITKSFEGASVVVTDLTSAEALTPSPVHLSERTETIATTSAPKSRSLPFQAVSLKGIGRNLQDHTVLPIMCVGKWWNRESAIKAVKERLRNVFNEETEPSDSSDNSGSKKRGGSSDPTISDVKKSSSVLSIGSVGSVLSIGSVGSIASIGKHFIHNNSSPFSQSPFLSFPLPLPIFFLVLTVTSSFSRIASSLSTSLFSLTRFSFLPYPFSIGCAGSIGSIGCVGAVGSIGSIASLSSIGSFASVSAVGGVGFLVVLLSWLVSVLERNEVNTASVWCTKWQSFYNAATHLCSRATETTSLYVSAIKDEISLQTALIYCTAVLLPLYVTIIVIRKMRNRGSKFSYPLNCVHGYVNLDEEGNILSRDSEEAPRYHKQSYNLSICLTPY